MSNTKKFAIILSGCGVYDGSEIHEATLSMYAIAKNKCTYEIFAPDVQQHHVVNHINGEEMEEKRNVLIESARIARGNIKSLDEFNASEFDVMLMPGGFGAAKNLSTYAVDGADLTVNTQVASAVNAMVSAGKPIGALCISPVIVSKILGDVKLTIGSDEGTKKDITTMGSEHIDTTHGDVIVDEKYKVATTPCYMLDARIDQIGMGAENVVKKLIEMAS
jgi:enhancing lycopene biosynthesis protein 2